MRVNLFRREKREDAAPPWENEFSVITWATRLLECNMSLLAQWSLGGCGVRFVPFQFCCEIVKLRHGKVFSSLDVVISIVAEDESWANEWNSIYLNKTRDRMGKRDDLLKNEKWENCVYVFMCGKDAAMVRQRKFINMSSVGLRCCVRYCQAQPHTDRHSPPSWVWNVRLDEKRKSSGKHFAMQIYAHI